ncbi:cytochrome c oxidase subunit 1 [Chytridiales sp. JEL 0842]|nr:cytochrome c oxidase subunit 1 [Chytridiales sp. JEL 0842]
MASIAQSTGSIARQNASETSAQDSSSISNAYTPRSTNELSVKRLSADKSLELNQGFRKLRSVALLWLTSVLRQNPSLNFSPPSDDHIFFNDLRFGVWACEAFNVIQPKGIQKIHEAQCTFSALENLAALSAALITYGLERRTLFKPLDLINATPKADETFTINILQWAILAASKSFKVPSIQASEIQELLDTYTPTFAHHALPTTTASTTASSTSLSNLSQIANTSPSESQTQILHRLEALDAGTSRFLLQLQTTQESHHAQTQHQLTQLSTTLELILRRLGSLETDLAHAGEQTPPTHSRTPSSATTVSNSPFGWMKPRLNLPLVSGSTSDIPSDTQSIKRGNSNESIGSLLDTTASAIARSGLGILDRARKRVSMEVGGSSPSLNNVSGIMSPTSGGGQSAGVGAPQSPKLFAKLPQEVVNANLPKGELMRLSVVYEFIETEMDYVKDLVIMVNYHKKEVQATKLVSDQDVNTLFSNLDQLIVANTKLANALQSKKEANVFIEEIGDVIAECADSFKVYTTYCSNYPQAMKLVHQLQTRPEFKEHTQKWMNSPEGRGLSLESFLIKPVQRICKYPLLMRELLKHTEKSHKDYPALEIATERIEAVVGLVNEATDALDKKEKVAAIMSRIESTLPLNLQDKKLLRDGVLARTFGGKMRDRYLVLFTDCLVVCKVVTKGRYAFEIIYQTNEICFKPADAKDARSQSKPQLHLLVPAQKPAGELFTIHFTADDEKLKWTESFMQAFKACPFEGFSKGLGERNLSVSETSLFGKAGGGGPGVLRAGRRDALAVGVGLRGKIEYTPPPPQHEPEVVLIDTQIWKRTLSATGQFYFYCPQTKETTYVLPNGYIPLDPLTMKPYESDVCYETEDGEEVGVEIVEGWEGWSSKYK